MKVTYLSFLFCFSFILKSNELNTNFLPPPGALVKVIGEANQDEISYDLQQGVEGNFWIAGRNQSESILLKIDAEGNLLEQLSFDLTNDADFFWYFFIDSDGMLIITARDKLNSPTKNFLLKLNPTTSEIIWIREYPIPAYTRLERVVEVSANGNYLVAGMITEPGQGSDAFLMEVDRISGASMWQKSFHVGATDIILRLRVHENHIYVGGIIRDGGLNKIRPMLMKLDLQGNIIWSNYYLTALSGNGRLYLNDFIVENDRILATVSGSLLGDNLDNAKNYLLAVDLDGALLLSIEYDFPNETGFGGLFIDRYEDGYLMRGNINSSPRRIWFIQTDSNFNPLNSKKIDAEGGIGTVINGQDIFFASFTTENSGSNKDILFGKFNIANTENSPNCDCYFDLETANTEVLNPFFEAFVPLETIIDNPLSVTNIVPAEINLPVESICECPELELEICDNDLDDDGDGLIDCDDPDLQDSCCCLVPIPLDLGPDKTFCEGGNLLLDAGNGYVSYTWQDGFQNQNYFVTQTGVYTVEVVDECEVVQVDSVMITALDSPFTTETLSICSGDSILVFGNFETEAGDYVSNFFAENGCDSTHQITLEVVETLQTFEQIMICSGDSILVFGNFETEAGDYFNTQTSEAGCDSIHTTMLEIIPELNVDFQTSPACENEDNGFVQAVVSGGIAPYQYVWETSNQNTDTLSNLMIGEYGLTVTDDFGCQLATTFTINPVADQMLDITVVDESCFGFQDGILMIEDATVGLNYSLDGVNFDTTTTFSNLPPDTYTLTVLADNGCSQTLDFTVENASEIILNLPPDTTLCLGDSLRLLPQTNTVDNLIYQWTPPFGLSCIDCPTPFARPFSNAVYSLLITDENGCTATDSMAINVTFAERLFAPNVFSPNNDGINDYFYLQSDKGVKEILEFKIFGRWGQLIFETSNIQPNNPQMGWDGFFKNEKLNPDVFVWMAKVEFLNGTTEIFKGDILLIK